MATAKKTTAKKKPAKRAYTRKPAPKAPGGGGFAYVGGPEFKADLKKLGEAAEAAASEALGDAQFGAKVQRAEQKHAHYFRDVSHLTKLDVYRITDLFTITDHALAHALKKTLAAGLRGAGKSAEQDVQEAIDSLVRWQEMQAENALKVA